ncbi:MAG: hypothetical protein NVS3B15_14850 [Sediminibacterium sp.]
MKKIKYHYNTHTLRYEKLETPLRIRILQVFGFIAASVVTGLMIFAVTFRYIDSPKEKLLHQQNDDLKENYAVLKERLQQLALQMDEIENRDNNVYRSIFEAQPIPDSARIKDMEQRKEVKLVQAMGETELIKSMAGQLNILAMRLAYQERSFTEIADMVKNKEKLLAAIPAIQPVSNKNLGRIASGFGYRIDPIYYFYDDLTPAQFDRILKLAAAGNQSFD